MAANAKWSETMNDIFTGKLVRLSAYDPKEMGEAFAIWARDSEYRRMSDARAASLPSAKRAIEFFEKDLEEMSSAIHFFGVRALADDALIGEMVLEIIDWAGRDAFIGLSIGARSNWNRGYGTDMTNVLLRFAFTEVNLQRVTLSVFEYNPRAIRTYEKAGFRHEGRLRQFLNKEGRRWDMLFMGILREEWLEQNMESRS